MRRKPLTAKFYGTDKEKMDDLIQRRDWIRSWQKSEGCSIILLTDVKKGERTKKAPLPFTTSTLQQEASKVLNFSTSKTMRIAQQLI